MPIHDRCHFFKRCLDLLAADDTVVQPVGQRLGRDAASGAVFHQADIIDVRHLRAANPVVDPTHNVPQNPLGVVLNLAGDLLVAEVAAFHHGDGQQRIKRPARAALFDLFLPRQYVNLVVMCGM